MDPCHRDGPASLSDILTDSTALWIEMDLSLRHYIIIVLIPTAQVLRLAFLAVSFFFLFFFFLFSCLFSPISVTCKRKCDNIIITDVSYRIVRFFLLFFFFLFSFYFPASCLSVLFSTICVPNCKTVFDLFHKALHKTFRELYLFHRLVCRV